MISLGDVAIFGAFVLLLYFAWLSVQAREYAYFLALKHCRQYDLQLLEQSVAFKALWLKRDATGKMRFWRSYKFEFSSTGDERYHGLVIMLGRRLERVELEPYRLPDL
jgi:hypothetical protein